MTQPVVNVGSLPGDGTGDKGQVPFQKVNQGFSELYGSAFYVGVDTGVANASVIATVVPTPTTFVLDANTLLLYSPVAVNTGSATLAVAGGPSRAIVNNAGGPLVGGELQPGIPLMLCFNGTSWQIVSSNSPALLNPLTSQEIASEAAGASGVVLFVKPVYNVDRYGVNSNPGVTPMSNAVQAAVSAALQSGGTVTYGGNGPYLLPAPINCTSTASGGCPPVLIRNLAPTHNAHPPQGFILSHNSIGFDCTGNDTISFVDPTITTQVIPAPSVFPTIGILLARNTSKTSLFNRIIRPRITGFFSIAQIYNYGSENLNCTGGIFQLFPGSSVNACCIAFTAFNYASVQSIVPGLIATGSVSMSNCNVTNGQFLTDTPNSTTDIIHMEGSNGAIRFRDGFNSNPGGRSFLYIDNTNSGSSTVTIDGIDTDPAGAPLYTIYFGPATASVPQSGWNVRGLRCNTMTGGYAIAAADAHTALDGWTLDPLSEQQSHGINIPGAIQGYSQLRLGGTLLSAGSATQGCVIIGNPSSISIPAAFNLATMIYNNAEQISGFGAPTGATAISNFPGSSATLAQCGGMLSLLLQIMLQQGGIGP